MKTIDTRLGRTKPDFTGQAHIPARLRKLTCRCARVLRWTKVEGGKEFQEYRAVCCSRVHFERIYE